MTVKENKRISKKVADRISWEGFLAEQKAKDMDSNVRIYKKTIDQLKKYNKKLVKDSRNYKTNLDLIESFEELINQY